MKRVEKGGCEPRRTPAQLMNLLSLVSARHPDILVFDQVLMDEEV
jgi:hypothetical protein